MTNPTRQAIRFTLFLSFLVGVALLAGSLRMADLCARRRIDRAPWAQRCFRGATWCLGIRVTCHGEAPESAALFVSNHVSWCDIPVIGGAVPMTFLSKSEVGNWPLIGWLARQAGTLFIKRGGGKSASIVDQITALLSRNHSIIVFPEGTTSTGITVLPFHGKLLRAAQRSQAPIQPVTIVYRRGRLLDHLAPFINQDDFLPHLGRLLREPPPTVDILLHTPVKVANNEDLSALAARLRETIMEGVDRIQSGNQDLSPADTQQPLLHQSLHASR